MLPDLTGRRAVWQLLSELFLDRELDDADFSRLGEGLRQSGYPLPELEHILKHEVAPVLGGNLLTTAGEWVWLNIDPVERRYLAGQRRSTLTGCLALRVLRADWARVKAQISRPV